MPSDDTKFQVLNDHYKDSLNYVQLYINRREWFFAAVIVVVIVMLFQISAPKSASQVISQAINKQFGIQDAVDISFVGSVTWFLLLGFTVKYLQAVVTVEKQYKYIHQIEEMLSHQYRDRAFTREGKFYLSKYPRFSDWMDILYRRVFPSILVGVALWKIRGEWVNGMSMATIFDSVILALLLVSVVLYMELVPIVRTINTKNATSLLVRGIGLVQRVMPFSREPKQSDIEAPR
jgi:ABC-type multidrug transport system fused ATPase/permease subunit